MSEVRLGYNQAAFYSQAIADLFYEILGNGNPADRELRNFFSNNRKCGSKDRKFISEGLFGLFRWYGWLKIVMPTEKPDKPIENKNFVKSLGLVLNLEGLVTPQAFKVLCEESDYSEIDFEISLEEKREKLSGLLGVPLQLSDLIPEWFIQNEGSQKVSFYEALQKRPPIWIRVQKGGAKAVIDELKKNNLDFEQNQNIPTALSISGKVNLTAFQSYRNGLFEIQDLASQCLVEACDPQKNQIWWDVCAGAGGKTLALADKLSGTGTVFASDKRKNILDEIKKRSARAGFKNIKLLNLDKEKISPRQFDGVLVDAPCSCTGTWRRNPDARWTDSKDKCESWSKIQLQILREVSHKVKLGGRLVYATCSASKIENEHVVERFLLENQMFELEAFQHPLTGEELNGIMKVDSLPEDCDIMFAARLTRKKN